MIPEKIYVCSMCGNYQYSNSQCINCAVENELVEYTITPTVKKFFDEKPKDGELIGYLTEGGEPKKASFTNYSARRFKGIDDNLLWFPVILPKEDV